MFEPLTILRTIVDPNPVFGGPPIVAGVAKRTRTIPGGHISETFEQPWPAVADLASEMLVTRRHCDGVDELFDPPILESLLPREAVPEAIHRNKIRTGGRTSHG
jgi:hypothetical protein